MDPLSIFKNRLQCNPTDVSPFELREWLSKNPSVTMEMVLYDMQTNPKYKHTWKFKHLAKMIPVEQLVEHNILPEAYDLHSSYNILRMKITLDTLLKTHSQLDYEWTSLSEHSNITLEDIQTHPELPWDYNFIMFNHNLEYKHLEGYFKPYLNENVFYFLSYNATYEQIMKHPKARWLSYVLSSKHIQKEHIPSLLTLFPEKDKRYLFSSVCRNPNLIFNDLIELFGEEASLTYAWQCPYFTFTDFQKYPITTWKNLTQFHDILPITFIKEHSTEPWDWLAIIQRNKTITYDQFDDIPKNIFPDMSVEINEWNIRKRLFDNKHISYFDRKCILEDLLKSPITDNVHLIASPLFLEPNFKEIKEYFAKKRMIRIIVECISNPDYLQCRKRLTREHRSFSLKTL